METFCGGSVSPAVQDFTWFRRGDRQAVLQMNSGPGRSIDQRQVCEWPHVTAAPSARVPGGGEQNLGRVSRDDQFFVGFHDVDAASARRRLDVGFVRVIPRFIER